MKKFPLILIIYKCFLIQIQVVPQLVNNEILFFYLVLLLEDLVLSEQVLL